MIKQFGFTYQILTDCVNYAIIKNAFPYSLKKAHITPVHKRSESTDQEKQQTSEYVLYCQHVLCPSSLLKVTI